MTAILAVTGPIFALIVLGWTVTRTGLLDPGTIRALGRYVVTLALPALIFRAVTAHEIEDLVDLPYLAAYLAGSLAVFGLAFALARRRGGAAARPRPSGPWDRPARTPASSAIRSCSSPCRRWPTPRSRST